MYSYNLGVRNLLVCVSLDCQVHSAFSTTISVDSYRVESDVVRFTFLIYL